MLFLNLSKQNFSKIFIFIVNLYQLCMLPLRVNSGGSVHPECLAVSWSLATVPFLILSHICSLRSGWCTRLSQFPAPLQALSLLHSSEPDWPLDIFFSLGCLVLWHDFQTLPVSIPSGLYFRGTARVVCPTARPCLLLPIVFWELWSLSADRKIEKVVILWLCQKLTLSPPGLPSCLFSGRQVAPHHEANRGDQPLFLQPSFSSLWKFLEGSLWHYRLPESWFLAWVFVLF